MAVARALVFEPDLVLAWTRPLGALDKNLREQMQYEIKHIHENLGVTVVYVTHDQSEALTMSNRIAVFNDGRDPACWRRRLISTSGRKTHFVAAFIGENNRLMGVVEKIDRQRLYGEARRRLDRSRRWRSTCGASASGTTLSLRPERVVVAPSEGHAETFSTPRVRGADLSWRPYPHPGLCVRRQRVHHQGSQCPEPEPHQAGRDHPHRLGDGGLPRTGRLVRLPVITTGRARRVCGLQQSRWTAPAGRSPYLKEEYRQ